MAEKPFREKQRAAAAKGVGAKSVAADKDDFQDKVHQELGQLKERVDYFKQKVENPKPEKDEGADKYAADKYRVDHKAQKHEKLEKERKDFVKEGVKDYDVFTPPGPEIPPVGVSTAEAQILARIAVLEEAVGKLEHFIKGETRPDLSRGALKDEPESRAEPVTTGPSRRRRRR
ncbi:MAG TPA: hypothetical protein VMW56_30385 [Candidatus Margulisiibacteriota bacterium]|nr:hypothetical protein [Candidatus Margulisiibacteriota bacterium]